MRANEYSHLYIADNGSVQIRINLHLHIVNMAHCDSR